LFPTLGNDTSEGKFLWISGRTGTGEWKRLKSWNKNFESDIKKQKEELAFEFDRLDKLGELGGMSADDWLYQQQCLLKLKAILTEEEVQ
jgi:hypothetical protein